MWLLQRVWYLFCVANKYDPIKDARRKFVQSRVSATGRSDAESKAKFRQRFDKLSSSKEGRQKIAQITNVAGIRKALAQSNKGPGRKVSDARTSGITADRRSPVTSRIVNLSAADLAATAKQFEMENPAWAGPLNQFGLPATPTRRDVLNQIQSGAIGNYNELGADPLPGGLGNRTMDRVDYLGFLKKLKFWD